VIDCFIDVRKNEKKIFFAGNGGSASTASHFAQDLGEVGRKAGKKGFKTLSLTDNISLITAIGNDYGYGKIFTIQMAELFIEGDVLVAISASGNSPNIVNAVELAKKMGGGTVGLVGFDGGQLKNLCDHVIHVKSQKGEYGPVEDIHMILDHMITSYLIFHFSNEKENL
jgi:D-sedoheptulose 7-phosphate isomerase